jgi:hypothetical protein
LLHPEGESGALYPLSKLTDSERVWFSDSSAWLK